MLEKARDAATHVTQKLPFPAVLTSFGMTGHPSSLMSAVMAP